jgi:alpha-beta hydrolase superfamily lysophospholipase
MTGVLLIHGAWHGPWCWDDFADRLADHGHDARAVQLRGHDQSPGRRWHRVRDYFDDVCRAAAQFAEPPVLVGHSMGGLLAQRYLRRHQAPGAVLLASVTPAGALAAVARLGARHPLLLAEATLLLSLRPFISTPALVRELYFTTDTAHDVVGACHARLRDESYRAFIDMMVPAPPWPRGVRAPACAPVLAPVGVRAPVLVLGAERDALITVREVERTACAYQTTAEIVPGMGHDMMLDYGWQKVADRVADWIRKVDSQPQREAAEGPSPGLPRR